MKTIERTNNQNEQVILQYVFVDYTHLYLVSKLQPKHFYDKNFQEIFEVIFELDRLGEFTVARLLVEFGNRAPIIDIIHANAMGVVDPTSDLKLFYEDIDSIVRAIIDDYEIRAIKSYFNNLEKIPSLKSRDILEGLSKLSEDWEVTSQSERELSDCVDDLERSLEDRDNNDPSIKSGIAWLDDITGGFCGSELIVIGGRPGLGKTAFALTIAVNAAKNNGRVLFFSLEMSEPEITSRAISILTKIPCNTRGRITEPTRKAIKQAREILAAHKLKIFIDAEPYLTYSKARQKAKNAYRKHNGLDLIIIDYLQIMEFEDKQDSRYSGFSDIVRALKGLAKELKIPIVLLSQLSRESVKIDKKGKVEPPRADHLKETGSIEQDADMILLLHNPVNYNDIPTDQIPKTQQMFILVEKHRHGTRGRLEVKFKTHLSTFTNHED